MPIEAPRKAIRWIHAPLSGSEVIVLASEGETWWSHWTRTGSKACSGKGCAKCAGGDEADPRYVYACLDARGAAFVEFGWAQYDKLCYIESIGAVGVEVEMKRERPRRNSVVLIEVVGRREGVVPQDIRGFVKALGL
jgi:hypothetical protein